jgi:hypothetical protein
MSTVIGAAPCGRSLNTGEEAVLFFDTIYCADCQPAGWTRGVESRPFALHAGAVCGGGNPLD